MKKAGYVTFGAIMAALSVVVMLVSHFPFLTYSLPAIASVFIMVAVLELGPKWAAGSYVASSFLVWLFAEKEAALLYILFFGYYSIIKVYIERIRNVVLKYVVKLVLFNGVIALIYLLLAGILGIEGEFAGLGTAMLAVLWLAANFVFVVYDICLVRLSYFYGLTLHKRVSRYIKK